MPNTTPWTIKDTALALLVVIIWGLNFVPMKISLSSLSPLELGVGRYVFAAIPLCFFIRIPTVRYRWLFATAICQGFGQFSLLFWALQEDMTASLASVLFQTQIYFTAIWGFIFYRHRPTKLLWASMTTAAIGLVFFAMSALTEHSEKAITIKGILIVLAGASMWGIANIISRQAQHETPDYNSLGYIVWSSAIAAIIYLIVTAIYTPDADKWLSAETWQSLPLTTWGSLAFLGWISTLIGYGLWTTLLKRHHANRVAPFSLGVPVIGMTAGLTLLGEPINYWQMIGAGFVGLSLILVVFGPRWLAQHKQRL